MTTDIDYSVIPGTTHLVDLDHSETNAIETAKNIILLPTPSEDRNDPLNWSRKRKWLAMFCIVMYVFAGCIPACCVYSIFTQIAEETDITASQLNEGTGYWFLFLGIGNLFLLPLAQQYGKRPVYLVSVLGQIMFTLWEPYVKNNSQWIASKILSGIFYAPVETLPELTIMDLFFEHERATYMGIYGAALFGSNYAAPMLAGFVNDSLGWKWVLWLSCIFGALGFVFMLTFMEETNYTRKLKVTRDSDGTVLTTITSSGEIKSPAIVSVVSGHLGNQSILVEAGSSLDDEYPPIRAFWQRLSLNHSVKKKNHLLDYFISPFYMLQFPVVLYCGFLYGSSLFWYSVLNGTESMVLSAEPYNFSAAMCGLAYVSPVIFVILIYPYAGWSADWIKIKIAKKHNGVSQAEDRLWVLIVFMILGPASLILWGVGASKGVHWFGIVFGLGLLAGLCIIGCVCSVTYVLDCYHELGSPAITVVIIIRNTMNFAMDYGITPFVTNVGLQNCFIASAFICLFCIGTFFVMIYTGLYWRKRTGPAYWKLVEKFRSKGIAY